MRALFDRIRVRLPRFALLSVARTLLGMVILVAGHAAGVPDALANLVGITAGVVLTVVCLRRFVWTDAPPSPFLSDVVAAVKAALLGLTLSTGLVAIASAMGAGPGVLMVAHLLGFVAAWPVQLFVLDRHFSRSRVYSTDPLRSRFLLVAAFMVTLFTAYMYVVIASVNPGDLDNTDDGIVDVTWAKLWARTGMRLHGHWSFTLTGFHPGPWYMATLTAGGQLADRLIGPGSFDSGAAIAVLATYCAMLIAASLLIGYAFRSPLLALGTLVGLVYNSSRATGGWDNINHANFVLPLWPGPLFATSLLCCFAAAVSLGRNTRFAPHLALLFSGLATQLYLPWWTASLPLGLYAALVSIKRFRAGTLSSPWLLGLLVLPSWVPLVARLVIHGPRVFFPELARADHAGFGWMAFEAKKTLSFHLLGLHWVVALAFWLAAVIVPVALMVRSRRLRGDLCVIAYTGFLALAQQIWLYPSEVTRYQTNWVELVAVALVALVIHRIVSLHPFRRPVRVAVAAILLGSLFVVCSTGLANGSIPKSASHMIGSQPQVVGDFGAFVAERFPALEGSPVEVLYDHANVSLFESFPQVMLWLNSNGIDACVANYPALALYDCAGDERPQYEMVLSDDGFVTETLVGQRPVSFVALTGPRKVIPFGISGVKSTDTAR